DPVDKEFFHGCPWWLIELKTVAVEQDSWRWHPLNAVGAPIAGRNWLLPPERGSVSRSHVGMFETLPSNPNAFQAAKPLRVTDPRSDYRAFTLVVVARCVPNRFTPGIPLVIQKPACYTPP